MAGALSERFDEALLYASRLHRGQVRKGTRVPCLAHLLAAAGLAAGRVPLFGLTGEQLSLIAKPIPSSGERIPVIGLGTNRYGAETPHAASCSTALCADASSGFSIRCNPGQRGWTDDVVAS
jgi:hypothetical protein